MPDWRRLQHTSLHNAASEAWGQSWYLSIDMDSRHLRQIKDAWSRLPRAIKDDPHRSDVPGRLVANCMFGFWANLLDEGGYVGEVPRRRKVDYHQLWPVFKRAFPGGGPEAREIRARRSASTGSPGKARYPTFLPATHALLSNPLKPAPGKPLFPAVGPGRRRLQQDCTDRPKRSPRFRRPAAG